MYNRTKKEHTTCHCHSVLYHVAFPDHSSNVHLALPRVTNHIPHTISCSLSTRCFSASSAMISASRHLYATSHRRVSLCCSYVLASLHILSTSSCLLLNSSTPVLVVASKCLSCRSDRCCAACSSATLACYSRRSPNTCTAAATARYGKPAAA